MTKRQPMPDNCPICGGPTGPSETVFAVETDDGLIVVRHVPATGCRDCGERWIDDETASRLEDMVNRARRENAQVEVLAYAE